jgi:prepilin-type N-terminal cleavage/methylation domain-containing protein
MLPNKSSKFKRAFTLVEILVVALIITVVFTSFYTSFTVGTRYIVDSKNRLGATALANEKMEIVRNLEYDNIGISGGIPSGNIPEDEDINVNGREFHVHTYIQYQDDPLDELAPDDIIPNDYKIVKITISWKDSSQQTQEIEFMSRFVPPGLETTAGGAPLAINVKGSDSSPVKQASVKIVNNDVSPAINFTVETDDFGHLMLPAAPPSLGGYQFTISKDGYETVATIDPDSVIYTPTYRHQDVLLDVLNTYDYIEDLLSNLTVEASDYQGNFVPDIGFSIVGGKVIGRDAENADVFNMDESNETTNAEGKSVYNNISPGNYTIEMEDNSQYELIEHDPSIEPFALVPGDTVTYKFLLADKNVNGLAVTVTDELDPSSPIEGAEVTLTDEFDNDVFTDKTTSTSGVVFYPDSTTPLLSGTYTLKVEASGYVTETKSITINNLTKETVKLTVE